MRTSLGANYKSGKTEFVVWAPEKEQVNVRFYGNKEKLPLKMNDRGYWTGAAKVEPGTRYFFDLDGEERPDPASRYQPEGVHGPSEVVDLSFAWTDQGWQGIPLEDMVMYELHTGTFSEEGNFTGIANKLEYLKDLGVNTIEIMPVAQFPGTRNWGYDGVNPFAVQNSYGAYRELQKLIDVCHDNGMAVVLDVVYNHLGPEGNYLYSYGPYFTSKYSTPWGEAINFDDAHSDEVRNYFIQNALMWFRDFHVDGLRLDAVHAIKDMSSSHFLKELSEEVHSFGRRSGRNCVLVGECDLNDVKYINPVDKKGYGLDGQWIDEFHHSIHALQTGEEGGYYADFGNIEHLKKAFDHTFVYNGNYSPHRKKTFGSEPKENPYSQFVVFGQNHDQVGNRKLGDRLSEQVSYEAYKQRAAVILTSPYVPMLFMGEEYFEEKPFQYFISHQDPELVEAVRKGRKEEFSGFRWEGEVPDPQSEETFKRSTLSWKVYDDTRNHTMWEYYRLLISLRKKHQAFQSRERSSVETFSDNERSVLVVRRSVKDQEVFIIFNFANGVTKFNFDKTSGKFKKMLDSADELWLGPGSLNPEEISGPFELELQPQSAVLYEKI